MFSFTAAEKVSDGRWGNVTQNNRAWGRSMCGGFFARGARSFLPGFPRSILRLLCSRVDEACPVGVECSTFVMWIFP